MRSLTVALAALLSLAFASRLSARPSIHVDSLAPSHTPTLTGSTGGEDAGTSGDDDDEDFAIVHHA